MFESPGGRQSAKAVCTMDQQNPTKLTSDCHLQEWGKAGAFPLLRTLWLTHNLINSTLPVSWGLAGAFPKLRSLRFDRNQLSGTLPDQWGQNAGFLNLQVSVLKSASGVVQLLRDRF